MIVVSLRESKFKNQVHDKNFLTDHTVVQGGMGISQMYPAATARRERLPLTRVWMITGRHQPIR